MTQTLRWRRTHTWGQWGLPAYRERGTAERIRIKDMHVLGRPSQQVHMVGALSHALVGTRALPLSFTPLRAVATWEARQTASSKHGSKCAQRRAQTTTARWTWRDSTWWCCPRWRTCVAACCFEPLPLAGLLRARGNASVECGEGGLDGWGERSKQGVAEEVSPHAIKAQEEQGGQAQPAAPRTSVGALQHIIWPTPPSPPRMVCEVPELLAHAAQRHQCCCVCVYAWAVTSQTCQLGYAGRHPSCVPFSSSHFSPNQAPFLQSTPFLSHAAPTTTRLIPRTPCALLRLPGRLFNAYSACLVKVRLLPDASYCVLHLFCPTHSSTHQADQLMSLLISHPCFFLQRTHAWLMPL